jgi:hypothetical protein
MTLVLLASAQALADDVDPWGMPQLRALLPIAGMTVIEQQAERARSLGVARMLLLIDGVPSGITEACDRIRARGLPVDLVRDARDVQLATGGADHVLLCADGLVAGEAPWQAIAAARASSLLVTDDGHATRDFERIDATTRWAGLGTIPKDALTGLADAPEGWDPQLLLLREAVQAGAPRLAWDSQQFVSGDIVLASNALAAGEAEARLLDAYRQHDSGIARRWLIGPLVRMAAGPLLGAPNSGVMARGTTLLLAGAAAACALAGSPMVAAGFGLIAATAQAAGDFVAGFRPERRAWRIARSAGLVLQILAFALVDRGVEAGSAAQWLGSGAMAATIMLLASMIVQERASRWPLIDLPAAWIALLVTMPLLGRETASLIVALAGLALLLLAERIAPWLEAWRVDRPIIPDNSV